MCVASCVSLDLQLNFADGRPSDTNIGRSPLVMPEATLVKLQCSPVEITRKENGALRSHQVACGRLHSLQQKCRRDQITASSNWSPREAMRFVLCL